MIDGILVYQEMLDVEGAMEELTDLLDRYDEALPQAEYDYQTTKHDAFLKVKAEEGTTVAREIVRGDPMVAEKRMVRDQLRLRRQTASNELRKLIGRHLRLRDEVNREYGRPSNY